MKKKTLKSQNLPLTLETMVDYNQKVLFPFLKETFLTKNEFNNHKTEFNILKEDVKGIKTEVSELKDEFKEFKNTSLTNFDAILKKLDIVITEKEVKKYQREKDKKMWLIIIKALEEHDILKQKHLTEITELGIF